MNADCDHSERRHRPLLYGAAAAALVVTGSITAYLVIGRTPALSATPGSTAPSAQAAVITPRAGSAAAPDSSTAPTPGQPWPFPPARVSAGPASAAAPAGTPGDGTPIGHVVPVSTVGAASVVVANSATSPAVIPASEGGSRPARESTPPSVPTRPGVPLRTASNPEAASTPMPAAPSPLAPVLSPPPVAAPEGA